MQNDWLKRHVTLKNLTFILSVVMFVWVIWYCYTGSGGGQELVSRLLPIALMLQVLFMYQKEFLYKRLPAVANHLLVAFYLGICVYAFIYFLFQYEEISIYRQGSYTTQDFVVGLLMFLLVMELSRLAHATLFWVNFVLIIYTMFGYLSPLDFFWHPGTSFYRVVTSSTVEMSNGIYGIYGQIALTLVAAFLLLASVANGFGAQGAMIRVMQRIAGNSRQMVPQAAVLGSLSIGMVSGSGSANAVVVGSITIPLMKRYGVPGYFAAATETAASMGGLIMPPMMGVGAFLMSEFLGVPYWDVVTRGFALAFIYYTSLAFAVYLICVRLLPRDPIVAPGVSAYEQIKTSIFFLGVVFLMAMMGAVGMGELLAALYTMVFMFVLLLLNFLYFKFVLKDAAAAQETFLGNVRLSIETHADMTSYLTLLLATLGIMIGLFTVTGFIDYREDGSTWREMRLVDGETVRWLCTEEEDFETIVTLWEEIDLGTAATRQAPAQIQYGGRTYRQEESGLASATLTGQTGNRQEMQCRYWDYKEVGGRQLLSIEQWGGDYEASLGERIRPTDLDIFTP